MQITKISNSGIIQGAIERSAQVEPQSISEVPSQPPGTQADAPTGPVVYKIPSSKLEWLKKKIVQINKFIDLMNKRSQEFGIPGNATPVVLKEGNKLDIEIGKDKFQSPITVPGIEVTLDYTLPDLGGYQFVATMTPMTGDDGKSFNLIQKTPEAGPIPEHFRIEPPQCEVCKQKRNRLETFLLKGKNGEFKQIGRNCLGKFFGVGNADMYASFAQQISMLNEALGAMEEEGEEGPGGSRGPVAATIGSYLLNVLSVIRTLGWVSRGKSRASEGKNPATADIAWILSTGKASEIAQLEKDYGVTFERREEDKEKAEKAVQWAKDLSKNAPENLDDYLWNLSVSASQNTVTSKTMGIVASLPAAYDKATATVSSAGAGRPFFFMGKIKEKKPTKTGSTMWKFENANGEVAVWFDNKHEHDDNEKFAIGSLVQFEAVIQKVNTFAGKSETQVLIKRFLSENEFFEGQKQAEEKIKQMDELKASAPPLSPGMKTTLDLTVMTRKDLPGFRDGTSLFYKFIDQYGRKFFWKTSTGQELEPGKTYTCNVTVGWEKLPGVNKAALDENGKKKLAVDKYDNESIKLDKVDPVSADGQAMVSKDDIKSKKQIYEKLSDEYEEVKKTYFALTQKYHQVSNYAEGEVPVVRIEQDQVDYSKPRGYTYNPVEFEMGIKALTEAKAQALAVGNGIFTPNTKISNVDYYLQNKGRVPTPLDEAEQHVRTILTQAQTFFNDFESRHMQEIRTLTATSSDYNLPSEARTKARERLLEIKKEWDETAERMKNPLIQYIYIRDMSYNADKFLKALEYTKNMTKANDNLAEIQKMRQEGLTALDPRYNRVDLAPSIKDQGVTGNQAAQEIDKMIIATKHAMTELPTIVLQIQENEAKMKPLEEASNKAYDEYATMMEDRSRGRTKNKASSFIEGICKFAKGE